MTIFITFGLGVEVVVVVVVVVVDVEVDEDVIAEVCVVGNKAETVFAGGDVTSVVELEVSTPEEESVVDCATCIFVVSAVA